jgi:TAP42-like family
MDVSSSSLRELYSSAKSKQEEIDSGSATHQEILQSAISAFEECRNLVAKLAVFSSNEEVEDISTQDLQYDQSTLRSSISLTLSQISHRRLLAGRAPAQILWLRQVDHVAKCTSVI